MEEQYSFGKLVIRKPDATDGFGVHRLVEGCKPLDTNSVYCNLLQCSHFKDTCRIATDGKSNVVAFVSGYIVPDTKTPGIKAKPKTKTLFIWQVAVSSSQRGKGLGKKLIIEILKSDKSINKVETTITKSNDSSWSLFKKLAEAIKGDFLSAPFFEKEKHFNGKHDTEYLVEIDFDNKRVFD